LPYTSTDKRNDYLRNYESRIRKETVDHYGGKCACCGEHNLVFLSIDHLNNGGGEERKRIVGKNSGGRKFYARLKRQGYPGGYQVLCYNCNAAKFRLGKCPHQQPILQGYFP